MTTTYIDNVVTFFSIRRLVIADARHKDHQSPAPSYVKCNFLVIYGLV
jgi:hypothetical protein